MREMQTAGRDQNEKVTGKRHLTCTFRMGIRGKDGEGSLWGRSAYNESEKVVEKGHLTRHLPGRKKEQGWRERPLRQVRS